MTPEISNLLKSLRLETQSAEVGRNPQAFTKLSILDLQVLERRAGIDGLLQFLRSGSLEPLGVYVASSPQGARVTQVVTQAPAARPRSATPQQICSPPLLKRQEIK